MGKKTTIIIGAGPAGLAAGYYLAKGKAKTTVLEKDFRVGGISKTIEYKGHRFDIGGHRFFTDIEEVKTLWHEILGDNLLKRSRLSRIYYRNKFFNYPLSLTNVVKNLGIVDSIAILFSYLKSHFSQKKETVTFKDYMIKHFGERLFKIFFKPYTEKVWGMPCTEISGDWASQRIKGLSAVSAVTTAVPFGHSSNIRTLIKEFSYPILGPGMMYEKMAKEITNMRGEVRVGINVVKLIHDYERILYVITRDNNGKEAEFKGDNFISSMPITDFIQRLDPAPARSILESSNELRYRDLLTINLICANENIFPDNWIYVHSPEVKLCRIQNYKNWSPDMVQDERKTTLGLEYFCSKEGKLWNMKDQNLIKMGQEELKTLGFAVTVEDSFVYRMPKAYPTYVVGYKEPLKIIRDYLRQFKNLQTIGRAGRFRYDNMDVAIASGISASKKIIP